MPCSTPTPSPSALAFTLVPAPSFWAIVPESERVDLLNHHLQRAFEVAGEYRLPLPGRRERLELAVMLAVEAELLFFHAAVYEPSREDLDRCFADFLRRALQSDSENLV